MHKLIIKSKSANTACGFKIVAYYPNDHQAMTENVTGFSNGKLIACCEDNSLVTCLECIASTNIIKPL